MNTFRGRVTDSELKEGTGKSGEWAVVSVEVTEENPRNAEYPQIGRFEMFKSGEYLKYAKDFDKDHPIGTLVDVEFEFKRTSYTKDGEEKFFYKTTAFKFAKVEETDDVPF
jgi:hypothetical protein